MTAFIGRREFITLLGGAAVWPLAARAQQAVMPVIGFLNCEFARNVPGTHLPHFRHGLGEGGLCRGPKRGHRIPLGRGSSPIDCQRWPPIWFDRQVDVIVAAGAAAGAGGEGGDPTIPIVFAAAPIRCGSVLAASLNRPGGNVTGMTVIHGDLVGKRLELLREMRPSARRLPIS